MSIPPRMISRTAEAITVALFILVMAAANIAIAVIGPWFLPVTAFVSVGIVLVSRDYLHDVWITRDGRYWPRMLAMITAAAFLSWLVDPEVSRIALASVLALSGCALTETVAFQAMIRHQWLVRSNASNVVGALADSMIFPVVAFGFGFDGLLLLILTQAATKVLGGGLWSVVARYTVNPDRLRARRRAAMATA